MPDQSRGLYETVITAALASRLDSLAARFEAQKEGLRPAEAGDRIALHLARIIKHSIADVPDKERVGVGIALARQLIEQISKHLGDAGLAADAPVEPGTILRAVVGRLPDGSTERIPAPLIPLLDTTLLTNAPGEPRVGHQLLTEIHSADRVDAVIAFIRRSGIAPMLKALREHCDAGRPVRVLTTTYTGSTETDALDALQGAGAKIRISYDTTGTRLHAKAWLFHRDSGYSTAYIGSSNLTHSAQIAGLEWNVRVSGARNPDVVEKVAAVFESYWNGSDFVDYDRGEFEERTKRSIRDNVTIVMSPIEVRLEPFQERMLEQIALSRELGHHRNLLVSATGTGKTVMAAVDYARLRSAKARPRLLFVAHREEILDQSLWTFRYCLRDPQFGEKWVGGVRPREFQHVFASIQSLTATGYANLAPDHFDVVIVDEFHHAAAETYRALLDHVRPVELLGLTATPERSDGLPVLHWFDDRISAELRLWDAIDQQRLVPFSYYGIHDGLDLREVPWRRGRGYDAAGLTNLLTANDAWARQVIEQLRRRVGDVGQIRALGFCVSVDHARFMARVFGDANINAVAVWADSPAEERAKALKLLAEQKVNVVFSVDLFNEGIDVPSVDTLLLLRPTDSPTLFLQQLGRGLRRDHGKTVCTVLDFVGQHRKEFRFDRRFRALLGGSRRELEKQVESGFPFLPAGCHIELDRIASDIVLRSFRESLPSRWSEKADELRSVARGVPEVRLSRFLDESGLDLEDVYDGSGRSWSDLKREAGLSLLPSGPHEAVLRKACGRLLHIDDAERIDTYRRMLSTDSAPELHAMPVRERRLVRMLVASVAERAIAANDSLKDACRLVWAHPQLRSELVELMEVLGHRINHLHVPLDMQPDVPLQIHARYSRSEILSGFGVGEAAKPPAWREGVYWARRARADLFVFTLDKTSGQFSPTTRYRDYAISRELIHWESQSGTRADSDTGRRYQTHESLGSSVMLFARLRADDRAFWFLGPATYVSHRGERPMAITWRLRHPLPGDLFASFAAAVA